MTTQTENGRSLLDHVELLHDRVESPSSSDVAAFYGWVAGIEQEAAVIDPEWVRAVRFVLDYWLTEYRRFLKTDSTFGIGTHPLNLVQAAMDGETDPIQLGLPDDLHQAFRQHLSSSKESE